MRRSNTTPTKRSVEKEKVKPDEEIPEEEKKQEGQKNSEIQRLKEKITATLQRTRDAIDVALRDAKKELDEIELDLAKQIEVLHLKEQQFEEEQGELIEFKKKLTQFASSSSKVKLDIGGTIFVTTRHTLCKEASMLSAMLNFNPEPDADGAYFIDRNPRYFHFLLEYLRSGQVSFFSLFILFLPFFIFLFFSSSFLFLNFCLAFSTLNQQLIVSVRSFF